MLFHKISIDHPPPHPKSWVILGDPSASPLQFFGASKGWNCLGPEAYLNSAVVDETVGHPRDGISWYSLTIGIQYIIIIYIIYLEYYIY